MSNMFLKITMSICLLILNCPLGYADTIYLKSGQKVEGKIIEKTDKYVKIDFEGVGLTYYLDEIDRISQETDAKLPSQVAEVNKMTSPEGLEKDLAYVYSIAKIVSQFRGLDFKGAVNYGITSKAEIKRFYIQALEKERDRLLGEEKLLKKLGLLPSYVDYYGLIIDTIPQQIGAYYSPEEKKLFISDWVPKKDWDSVIVHEVCHALQDQYFDLNLFLEKDKEVLANSDKRIARQSLVEGEAYAIMLDYQMRDKNIEFTSLPNISAYIDMIGDLIKSYQPGLSSAPTFLGEALLFPYLEGLNFLREVRIRHPWSWVSNIYQDPPQSSEQILHPEKYLEGRDEPISVELPNLTQIRGDSWHKVYEDTLGEFTIRSLIKQFSDSAFASLASEGWGGDTAVLLNQPATNKSLLVYLSNWDSREDAEEFFWAYQEVIKNKYLEERPVDYAEASIRLWDTEGGMALLEIRGNDVLVIEGALAEFQEDIRDRIWNYAKSQRPFAENQAFLNPRGLKAEDFYQRGKAIYDQYKGNTLLLYEALTYFKKAIELNKDFIQAYVKVGDVMVDMSYESGDDYNQESAKEAITWIEKANEINPKFPDIYYVMAKIDLALTQYVSAESKIQKAIELDPNNSRYYYWLGRIYSNRKDYAKAIGALNKSILLDPKHGPSYDYLGRIYHRLKDDNKALDMYKKALEIDPEHPWTWNNYSTVLLALGRYDEAIEACKKALTIMNFGMAHRNLGSAYMAKKLYEEAEKEFKLINDTEMLSVLYREMKLPDKQMVMVEKTLQRDSQNAFANIEKARVLKAQGKLDEALEYYRQALTGNPKSSAAYHGMGQIYKLKNNISRAIESYNKAIELDSTIAVYYYDLGIMYDDAKYTLYYNPLQAITFLEKSRQLNNNYADTYYALAKAYEDIDDRQNSVPNFERYLELAPNGDKADFVRGYLKRIK